MLAILLTLVSIVSIAELVSVVFLVALISIVSIVSIVFRTVFLFDEVKKAYQVVVQRHCTDTGRSGRCLQRIVMDTWSYAR